MAVLLGASSIAMASGGTMSMDQMNKMDHMGKMQTHLQEMRMEMTSIRLIKDPRERRLQMQKHLLGMTSMMNAMHNIYPKMSEMDQQVHMQMLEKRLDLLQEMIMQVVEVQYQEISDDTDIPTYD